MLTTTLLGTVGSIAIHAEDFTVPIEMKEDKVVNIPDVRLKVALNEAFNTSKVNGKTDRKLNENISQEELLQVTRLDFHSKEITDFDRFRIFRCETSELVFCCK